MPSPLTETSVIAGTPDAFHDAHMVAEVVRIYNYKRAFCGQSRIDLGTPTTKVFKNATDYSGGPVATDVDTDVSCREEGSFRDYLLLLWIAIPQTYLTKKTVGADSYFWVTPGTDDPLPLPDGWEDLTVTADTLKEPAFWGTVFPLIIEAVNALTEMAVTVKPVVRQTGHAYTARYVTYSLEDGPESFQVVNGGAATRGTRRRPIFSTAAIDDRAYTLAPGEVAGVRTISDGNPVRWSFTVPGFSSSEYFFRDGRGREAEEWSENLPDFGSETEGILGVYKVEFDAVATVQTTGTYTIAYGVQVRTADPGSSLQVTAEFDGDSQSFPITSAGIFTVNTTRSITAPSETFSCSLTFGFGITDFWGGTPVETYDSAVTITVPTFDGYYNGNLEAPDTYTLAGGANDVGIWRKFTSGFPSAPWLYEQNGPSQGAWLGKAKDSGGNIFTVPTSGYALAYMRKTYRAPGGWITPVIGIS